MTQSDKFASFQSLHRSGEPLILFNIWDAGSAAAVAAAGAPAIATGSASVAGANGLPDGEAVPIDLVLANAARIVAATDLPVTVDFEGGYAADSEGVAANIVRLLATGAVGCNFEDQEVGTDRLHEPKRQAARIAAARAAAGADFFINARTDLFLKAKPAAHDDAMVEAALERAKLYAEAGASGFFVPGLGDLRLLERVCSQSPLPVNFMAFPGGPEASDVAKAGAARISHGPFPFLDTMRGLGEAAAAIYRS